MGPQAARLLLFSALLQSVLPPAAPANGRRPDRLLQAGHTGGIAELAFSPDGRHLASVGANGGITVWDHLRGTAV